MFQDECPVSVVCYRELSYDRDAVLRNPVEIRSVCGRHFVVAILNTKVIQSPDSDFRANRFSHLSKNSEVEWILIAVIVCKLNLSGLRASDAGVQPDRERVTLVGSEVACQSVGDGETCRDSQV